MTAIALNPSHRYVEEGRQWYDTKEGVESIIKTLDGLKSLISERYKAGYVRGEQLNQLHILGNFFFDTVGNTLVSQWNVRKNFPDIPAVLDHSEFWEYIKEKSGEKESISISFAFEQSIPNATVLCPFCKKGWNIENIQDVVQYRDHLDPPVKISKGSIFEHFLGKTLGELKSYYSLKTDGYHFIGTDPFLKNDRFIDLSPWSSNPKSEFEKKMVKNDSGWVGNKEGITDDYIIAQDDIVDFSVIRYFHADCNSKNLENEGAVMFSEIFSKAGFTDFCLEKIPNEYSGHYRYLPWFKVKTHLGIIKIGWRKRVINIDWSELSYLKTSEFLFPRENVTKEEYSIHAWGHEKAIEYLAHIASQCNI